MKKMTLRELKNKYVADLSHRYTKKEAGSLFFIMLQHRSNSGRLKYLWNSSMNISNKDKMVLMNDLNSLAKGKPWQYITGEVEFCGLLLSVNSHTLIPRPETEELVEYIRQELKNPPKRILDIGTGSGCLAIALKHFYPAAEVWAIDVSERALEVAQKNATCLNLDIRFQKADILDVKWQIREKFDLIVSNPPYISKKDGADMEEHIITHEPEIALFVKGFDPLIFYKAIRNFSSTQLNSEGSLFTEVNQKYGTQSLNVFSDSSRKASLAKDISGNDRFIKACIQ